MLNYLDVQTGHGRNGEFYPDSTYLITRGKKVLDILCSLG
jgi:hypothetical protein